MSDHRLVVLTKLRNRIRAMRLMQKHNFVTAQFECNQNEYHTTVSVAEYIEQGGKFSTVKKGFVSCVRGTAVCMV